LDFIRFAATAQGKYQQAINASKSAAESIPKSNYHMGDAQHILAVPYFVLKIFGKWNEILAEPMPDSEYPYLQGIWHYTRGSAFLGKGRIDSAKAELNKIKQLIPGAILDEIMIRGDAGKTLLELAAISLEGEILFEEGDAENATKIFREAVDMQDQLTYSEPPEWSQSVRLFLGDALIQAGEYNKAELIFIEDLEEFREYGWGDFG